MAGATLQIDAKFNDQKAHTLFKKLLKQAENQAEILADIGEYLITSQRDRFTEQVAPDGAPWEPLKPRTIKNKKRNADQILVQDGLLRDLMRYEINPDQLLFGTDRIYGATHQFGDESRGIPERPYLGLSSVDEDEILDIIRSHFGNAMDV